MFKESLVHQSLIGSVINQDSGRTGREFSQLHVCVSQEHGDVLIVERHAQIQRGPERKEEGPPPP